MESVPTLERGRNDEDASLQELEIPVTTDPVSISRTLQNTSKDALTVVFCTYHSLELIEKAQVDGAPVFDLIICDEAHRTTGIEHPDDSTSPFVLVHDEKRIRASKRLYMTATPRLYTESAKTKAARHNVEVYSMDNPASYGPRVSPPAIFSGGRAAPAIGLQGSSPCHVRTTCRQNFTGTFGIH